MEAATVGIVLVNVLLAVGGVGGQSFPPWLEDKSLTCAPAMTDPFARLLPGSDCCIALKNAMTKGEEWFCSLFNGSSSSSYGNSFPINMPDALAIPSLCGISIADLSMCNDAGPASPKSLTSPPLQAFLSSPRLTNRAASASSISSSTPSSEASSSLSGPGSRSSGRRLRGAVKPWSAPLSFLFASSLILAPLSY